MTTGLEVDAKGAPVETVTCDLCILGAGIAGLNALYVASRHMKPGQTLVLVDRAAGPAGMWNGAYAYVRLHQPHPMFTAGNIAWQGQSDPHHLATRGEVIDHLRHCFDVLTARCQLDARFGHEYLGHEEGRGDSPVVVTCRRTTDGVSVRIVAGRLIKAFGYSIQPQPPLVLASTAVRSVSPDSCDLAGPDVRDSAGPIYVVGGGKTGMDTAHMLIRTLPQRRVRMLIGAGTMFTNRDHTMPSGLRRHYAGITALEAFLEVAAHFDGHNEVEVMRRFRREHCVSLDDDCRRFMFGVLSPAENREIAEGLDQVIRDHLTDVVDGAAGPEMVLRSGARRPIEPDSVIVNATGYIAGDAPSYEPYLSAGHKVLSIQPTSTVHFLSSQSAYFLTHLFLLGQLAELPLYETDIASLRNASRDVFPAAAITLTLYNTVLVLGRLPRWALDENGLDFMKLCPTHRRLLALAKLMFFLKRHPNHMRDSLDAVRLRFGVRLGPLPHLTLAVMRTSGGARHADYAPQSRRI